MTATTPAAPRAATTAPGPKGVPLLGSLGSWRRNTAEFLLGLQRDYGEVVRMRLGPMTVHQVTGPEAVHQVLVKNHGNYVRGPLYEQFGVVMGKGLLTSDGEYWRGHRRAVQPAFQKNAVLGIVPNIVRATEEMLDEWDGKAARGEPVDLMTEMLRLTLVTLSRSLFAYDIKPSSRVLKQIVDDVVEVMFRRGTASEMLPSWLPTDRKRKIDRIHQVFDKVVADVRETYARTGDGSLISLMEQAVDPVTGEPWTDQEIRDELLTIYLAGHETTAVSLCWTLLSIANHPPVQEELDGEIGRVLGGGPPDAENTDALTYTKMVVDESLRMHPPIWIFPRAAVGPDTLGGYDIEAGSSASRRRPGLGRHHAGYGRHTARPRPRLRLPAARRGSRLEAPSRGPRSPPPARGREDRRTALASFVQLTDLHLTDVQHPVRTEYLRVRAAGAWRPQEALTVLAAVALVERVNALRGGPVTGADLGFVMTTGDNTDNNNKAELDWFLRTMSGGRITPDTGEPGRYEGVQDSGLPLYWHPDAALRDADKQRGFPRVEGYLAAALRPVNSPGLRVPWYSTVGNHDDLPSGCFANGNASGFLADFAVGGRKLLSLPVSDANALEAVLKKGDDPRGSHFTDLLRRETRRMRRVTPDPARAPFTGRVRRGAPRPAYAGAGPAGHGYTRENADTGNLYYSFRVSDGVLGISLDTTDRGGHFAGSIGAAQLGWLRRTLAAHQDDHVIVFSHHNSWTFDDGGGDRILALLKGSRNVVAWINGHSHRNAILAHDTFWEISTASHVEFPQLARVVELTDNHDGTLSLFTTLIESAAPHRTDYTDLSQTGLAALYRELSLNAPGAGRTSRVLRTPGTRNSC